jgi:hypothetical protein
MKYLGLAAALIAFVAVTLAAGGALSALVEYFLPGPNSPRILDYAIAGGAFSVGAAAASAAFRLIAGNAQTHGGR